MPWWLATRRCLLTPEQVGASDDLSPVTSSSGAAFHGEVHVVSRVVVFKKIKFYTNENVGSGELELPEQQMHTSSYWLTIPAAVMAALPYSSDDRRDGVVGLAFAMRHVAQLLLMCDRHDVGVSIDGPREMHDAYRVDKGGKPTFDRVIGGLEALKRNGVEWNALTTVNAANGDHGREVYGFRADVMGAL